MGIIRGGDAEYENTGSSIAEKTAQLVEVVTAALEKDPAVLELKGRYYSTEEMEILSGIESLRSVRSLDLSDNQIGNPGLSILFQASVLEGLEELNLGINFISEEGIVALCEVPSVCLRSLKKLFIPDNSLSDVAGAHLVRSSHFPELRHLDLGWNEVGNETAKALGETLTLPKLETLVLERSYIDDEGIQGFVVGGVARQLRELNLTANKLTDAGARTLAASSNLSSLQVLHLSQNLIADEGARALGGSSNLAGLTHLYMGRNYFGVEGAQALFETKTLTSLKTLVLKEGVETTPGLVNFSRPELLRPDAE